MKLNFLMAILIVLLPPVSYGEKSSKHEDHSKPLGVEALSSDLRSLLNQEMKALQDGMMSIIPAYISGNWFEIEKIARKMKNSYILKQSLTKSQLKGLHNVLPGAFIEEDQRFHYLAGMLEHAAKNKKAELVNFYFSEMNEACISCHSKFATHRFQELLPVESKEKHTH